MSEPTSVRTSERLLGRDFVLLWQGQLASQIGNQAFLVASMSWMLDATSSAALLGLFLAASSLPAVLLGPFAGVLADRHSRRTLIVTADLLRGAGHVALAAVMVTSPGATNSLVALFLASGCLSGTLGALVAPALAAAIPDLVPPRQLAAANSLHHLSSHAAALVGFAGGGLAYVWVGASGLIFFNGLTLIASAACARFARVPHTRPAGRAPGASLETYARDVRAGLAWLWAHPALRSVTLTFAAVNFLFMPIFVLLPIYVQDVLGAGPQWYGFLLATAAAGAMVGAVLSLGLRPTPAKLTGALLGIGACATALGLTSSRLLALVLLGVGGLLSAMLNVGVITAVQAATPAELRGRVLSVTSSLAGAAVPAGLVLGGFMGGIARAALPDVISTCGLALLAAAILFRIRQTTPPADLEGSSSPGRSLFRH